MTPDAQAPFVKPLPSLSAAHGVWLPTLIFVWVCLQGAFGAWTVTLKLFPAIVTLHLAGGIILLVLLVWQLARLRAAAAGPIATVLPAHWRALLRWAAALLALQILLGGWVSTNYAVLVCGNSFPSCQGSWWPDMDFAQGFQIWRELGLQRDGSAIGFPALTAIHYTHRLLAVLVLLVMLVLAWRLQRFNPLRNAARWLGALALLQLLSGLSNVVLDWPIEAALLHTAGAAALAATLTWMLANSRSTSQGLTPFAPGPDSHAKVRV